MHRICFAPPASLRKVSTKVTTQPTAAGNMTRGPTKQDFGPSSQPHHTSAKHLGLLKSIRGRNSGVRIAQIISLQEFIKSAMFSSEYTDFFGMAAPAAGFWGKTETLSQKMTYPDFLWDHKCYHAYFMATLTNLRAQWRQRHSGHIPRRCHNYDSTKIGDVVAKRLVGLHKFIRCHPWTIGYAIGSTAEVPQDTEDQHTPVYMPHDSSIHHNLTILARHIWSASMIQRAWKRYLQKSSQKQMSMHSAAFEQELFTVTLHPSRLFEGPAGFKKPYTVTKGIKAAAGCVNQRRPHSAASQRALRPGRAVHTAAMAQNEEVVPSGQALKRAATWLGITDPAKLLDDDPAAAAFQPRPEGLGLGAKFLAHHKAAHLTMPLEKHFGKRLQRASAQGDNDAVIPTQKRGRPTGKYQVQQKIQEHGASSDEEEVGRSAAFSRKKLPQIPQGQRVLRLGFVQATANGKRQSCEASSARSPEG
ncbi:hypothetical protein WJX82_001062 [Trebouxia sp. C0006]